MSDAGSALDSKARHWLADAAVGGALALTLITVAHAALPKAPPHSLAPLAAAPAPAVAAQRADGPKPLLAFQAPLPGHDVGSPFGLRQLPWEDEGRLHAGVDIAAPSGEVIRAAADGVVVRLGQDPGYGRYVVVRHAEGLSSLYGHMGGYADGLAPGKALKAGDAVGQIGSTGTSTGSHLHFEIHDAKDRALNPELFLGRSFFTEADLPLRQAMRVPRMVRVAYVSMIPKAKQDEMEAKAVAAAAELAAADAASIAAPPGADGAPSADGAAKDAVEGPRIIDVRKTLRGYRQRPHSRYAM